jgi:hypothetical protein
MISPRRNHTTNRRIAWRWRVALACVAALAAGAIASAQQPTPTPGPSPVAGEEPAPERDVERAAQKVVAPVGVPMQSTEDATLGTGPAVAPAPGVTMKGDRLMVEGGETTESVAVASGAELLLKLKIVAPPKIVAKGSREVDETTPTQLFNEAEVRKLLGEKPTVVYQVVYRQTPIPDPMVVPWLRNAVIIKERYDEAIELLGQGKVQQGREALLAIEAEFPNTEYAVQSAQLLKRLSEIETAPTPRPVVAKATPGTLKPEINVDPNVQVSSILVDQENPVENRVMVNGRGYVAGELVRGYQNHRIVKVLDGAVVIEVEMAGEKKEFSIPVRPTGSR